MDNRNLTLLTDLYELTMMNGYLKEGKGQEIAIFDVFFRQNELITYSLAAGLEQAIDYVLNLNFDKDEIEYLKSLNLFNEEFLTFLSNIILSNIFLCLRFSHLFCCGRYRYFL